MSTRDPSLEPGDEIAMTATGWVVRCDRGLTSAETREFADWRSVPLHAAEFERIERIWRTMDLTDAVPRIQTMANEVMIRAHGRRRRRQRARWAFPLAAAVAIMASAFWWSRMPATNTGSTPEAYQVLASTARQVHLPDGSLASLNGDTQIETDFSQAVRHVRLMHGEAHFLVARNPDRPFLVSAGPVAVRAVGTAFNVRLADRSIEVLVTEGEVRVERTDAFQATGVPESIEPLLAAGQMAVIDVPLGAAAPLAVSTRLPIEIDDALAWQTTRLAFNNTPLDEVVAAFNRYNAQKLVLGDAALRNRTLTGIFRADNLAGFTRLLRASVDVEARVRSGNSILLLPRRGD